MRGIKCLLRSTLQQWIKTNYENYNFIIHWLCWSWRYKKVTERSAPTQLLVTKGYLYTRAELSSEITFVNMNYVGEQNIKIIKWCVTHVKNSFSKQFNCIMVGYLNLPASIFVVGHDTPPNGLSRIFQSLRRRFLSVDSWQPDDINRNKNEIYKQLLSRGPIVALVAFIIYIKLRNGFSNYLNI